MKRLIQPLAYAARSLRSLKSGIVHCALCIGLAATAWAQEPQEEPQQPSIPRPDPAIAEFARGVKFTVAGYNGAPEVQTNFPVLVRLSTDIVGFDYGDFYNASVNPTDPDALRLVDIGFVDAEGNGLAYDIDTWNTNGESLVWVNLPIMTNKTEFTMWYRSSKTGKDLNPDNVWTNYAGVWHFREDYGAEATSVKVYDSTTNSLTGDTIYTAGQTGGQQPATVAASACSGKLGRSRRMGNVNHKSNKGKGGITVDLGATGSAKRKAVDDLVDKTSSSFSGSFWIYGEVTFRYPYYVSRKSTDGDTGWGIQSRTSEKTTEASIGFWARSNNDGNDAQKHLDIGNVNVGLKTWTKFDFVYTDEGTTGKGYLYKNGVLLNRGGSNLVRGPADNTDKQLYIGGGDCDDNRPFLGLMDEVRLCYGVPTEARVKAEYDTVNTAAFLTAGEVVEVAIVERPVVNFTVADIGASHIQFGGTLSSLGASEATKCTFYAKVWPTASNEPETWTAFASNLTVGAFSGLKKGLTSATAYSYALMVSNDVAALSYETRDVFTTSGVGVSGTGGDVTRVGDDWIHYFRVGIDDESGDTVNDYTFTPPSYATTVRALVVAGGGPGGYRSGGGGGAGGLIYNAALGVTGGNPYTITVGEGGAASDDILVFGSQGGSSSISNGVTEVVRTIGGGAGGNGYRQNVSGPRKGQDGGSGGGAAANAADPKIGAGTSGQGNNGGTGSVKNENWFGGGGGGAGSSGGNAITTGTNVNGAGGGTGLAFDITGADVFYAGGGGGGSDELSSNAGSPGAGGSGVGGTGSRKEEGTAAAATQGVDGTGSGGGGGCGDDANLYKGGDGGDGIVIIRYVSQGDPSSVTEPIISLQSAVCNDEDFTGDVTFRVAWGGYNADTGKGYEDVAVKAVWGYSANALNRTNDLATGVIGIGSGSFPLMSDERTVFVRLLAVNAGGVSALSSETLSFYVEHNDNAQNEVLPAASGVLISRVDGAYATVTGLVTSAGMSSSIPSNCTVRVNWGTSAGSLNHSVEATFEVGAFTLNMDGLFPNTTYYWDVELQDDDGNVVAAAAGDSFTTLGASAVGVVKTSADQQTFNVTVPLVSLGAGTTYVLVRWSEDNGETWGDFVTAGTRTATDAPGNVKSPNYRRSSWGSVKYECVISNECVTSAGVHNGVAWSVTQTGTIDPVDSSTYTWQPVDGDWNGAWSDPAHWSCSKPDNLGYPQCNTATVVFNNNTTATIDVPGDYTFKDFSVAKSGVNITFVGEGAVVSALRCNIMGGQTMTDCSWTFSALTLAEENGIDFGNTSSRNVTLTLTDGTIASVGNSTISMYGSNVWMVVENGASFRNAVRNGTTDGGIRIDDGTVTGAHFRTDYNGNATTNEWFIFSGAAPRLTAASSFRNESNAAQHLQNSDTFFVFSVPVAGWAAAPLYAEYSSSEKLAGFLGDANGKYVVGVDETSDAFNDSGTVTVQLVSWRSGIATNNVSLAEVEGVSYEWTYGWPSTLQEPASAGDAPTGLKAVITGRGPVTASLTIPSPLPDNVSLVSVTTNGFAVVLAEGVYTVERYSQVTATFAAAEGYTLVGEASVTITVNDDMEFPSASIPNAMAVTATLTFPEMPANVSVSSVTTNGHAVVPAEGAYTVEAGAAVTVTFAAETGYRLLGAASTNMTLSVNTVFPSASIPTAVRIAPTTMTVAQSDNVSVSVTTNGVAVAGAEGVYTVMAGDTVTVTFSAAEGYVLTGAPASVTVTVVEATAVASPTAVTIASMIKINEIMASNPSVEKGGIASEKGIAEMDWIELYNGSSQAVDLTGWHLSDNAKPGKEDKATILGSCVIPANGYKIVWLDKIHIDPSEYAADEAFAVLKLSSSGEFLQLADPSKAVVQQIDFSTKKQIKGYSYGPVSVQSGDVLVPGDGPFVYMKTATPGAANVTEGWGDFTPTVYFQTPHGYKTTAFDLELVCSNMPNADIYYTLDGTSPTVDSTLYTGPIHIDRTTVVRAAVPTVGSILQFDTSATYIFLDDVLEQARSTTAPASAVGFPNDNAVNNQEMLYGMGQSIVTGADRDRLLRGFTNSIATLSIVVDPSNLFNSAKGIYVNPRGEGEEWERQIMLEGFDPTGVGADFSQPAGIRIRGGNSRNTGKPKHSLRFFFRSSYGESSLAAKMFPGEPLSPNGEGKMKEEIGEYDKLDLRTSQNLSWANENSGNDTFVTEVFSRDSQRDLGQPYTRSRYYNLFINGQYWGLYQTQERGDEHWGEAYLGGDALQYDLIKTASTFINNKLSYSIECNEGTWDAWSNLWEIATKEGFEGDYTNNYNRVLGLNPDGTRNPAYPILLNAESLMAYMLVSHYVVDQDGPTSPFSSIDKGHANNFYAIRNRDDAGAVNGFVFLRHDAEISMGQNGNTGATQNPTFWGTEEQTSPTVGSPDPSGLGKLKFRTIPYFTPAELHYLLMQNPTYKRAYADMFYRECLREGGAMTVEKATERYTSRMAEIDDAIVCEAARWGKGKSRSTWLSACSSSVSFITNRLDNMKTQYQNAGWYPTVAAPFVVNATGDRYFDGGEVPYQEKVSLQNNEASGTLYYTIDGTDPADSGVAYAAPFSIPDSGATVRARLFKDNEWSPLEEVALEMDIPNDQRYGIRIAAVLNAAVNDPADEFIVLTNKLDRSVSLEGLSIWSEKAGQPLVKITEIGAGVELAAGGTIKLTQPANWLPDVKLKNGNIDIELRDFNGKRIQKAFVDSGSWFWTGEYNEKNKKIYACDKTGRWFIALDFVGDAEEGGAPGGEVILESQWTPSPNSHTILFVTCNGTVTNSQTVAHGAMPEYEGEASGTNGYVTADGIYAFTGWDPTLAAAEADATYTATYVKSGDPKATVITVTDAGATTNVVGYYASLADAIHAADDGDTVVLLANETADATKTTAADRLVVTNAITIDFGPYTYSVPGSLEPTANWCALFIDADTVVKGTTGGIDCLDKSDPNDLPGVYAFNVREGATLTIAGGVYHGGGTVIQTQLGSTVINGGTFSVTPFDAPYGYDFALNCVDGNYQAGNAGFEINGGTFVGFDPQDIAAEGEHTDFTDDGYVAIDDGNGNFIVQPGWNVTFDADGGTPAPEAQRVADGGTATAPDPSPTKEGCNFDGWFAAGAETAYDFSTVLTNDLALTAHWSDAGFAENDTVAGVAHITADQAQWLNDFVASSEYTKATLEAALQAGWENKYLLNVNPVTGSGAITITSITVNGSSVTVTVGIDRTEEIGAIKGTLKLKGTATLGAELSDVGGVEITNGTFPNDETVATMSFENTGSLRFFKAVIE